MKKGRLYTQMRPFFKYTILRVFSNNKKMSINIDDFNTLMDTLIYLYIYFLISSAFFLAFSAISTASSLDNPI